MTYCHGLCSASSRFVGSVRCDRGQNRDIMCFCGNSSTKLLQEHTYHLVVSELIRSLFISYSVKGESVVNVAQSDENMKCANRKQLSGFDFTYAI